MIPRGRNLVVAKVALVALLLFIFWWSSLERVNIASHTAMCQNNLKLLENAKDQWAAVRHKGSSAICNG